MLTRLAAGVVSLGIAFGVAGCGGDERPAATSPQLSEPGRWADGLCTSLSDTLAPVPPPSLDPEDPVASAASLGDLYRELSGRMGTQIEVLRAAGQPPSTPGAATTYTFAVRQLVSLRRTISKDAEVLRSVGSSSARPAQARRTFKKLSTGTPEYAGPVAALRADPDLSAAIDEAPACQDIVQAG